MAQGFVRPPQEIVDCLRHCRASLAGIGVFTAAVNLLYLTGSLFMLEIYDRVIPSHSVPTLIGLCVIALALYLFQGLFDILRSRMLIRVGRALDERLAPRVFDLVRRMPLATGAQADSLAAVRDLDQIRGFVSGGGPAAFFDLPWIPLYLAICFAFDVWLGVTASAGALILFAVALATEWTSRAPAKASAQAAGNRMMQAEAARRNAEVIHALGMASHLAGRWQEANSAYCAAQQSASDVTVTLGGASKVLRMALQSAVLAVGAILVIEGRATAGIITAGSMLAARALAPVEAVIAQWKLFQAARLSWRRLCGLLEACPVPEVPMPLPKPSLSLAVQGITASPPGQSRVVAADISFMLKAGQGLGIIGPSGSGKSSLARTLVGAWPSARGSVRLDGACLDQFHPDEFGSFLGYMPQDVELFSGSVVRNIARFNPEARAQDVLAAAKLAGVHDLILKLPDGYSTQIGEGGAVLSAGQRQRVGLARALFGDPFLVVLDEPNSNLDSEGEEALTRAILQVRARGGIVIVIAHRPSALAGVDQVLAMAEGRVIAFGPRDEILSRVIKAPGPQRAHAGSPWPLGVAAANAGSSA